MCVCVLRGDHSVIHVFEENEEKTFVKYHIIPKRYFYESWSCSISPVDWTF